MHAGRYQGSVPGGPGHWQVSELLFLPSPECHACRDLVSFCKSQSEDRYEALSSILVEQDMTTGLGRGLNLLDPS